MLLGLKLVQVLAERLHAAELRYANVVGKDVPARLASLILTLVDSEGLVTDESYRIPTRYTQEQLASMIGCKRVAKPGLRKVQGDRSSPAQGAPHHRQGSRHSQGFGRSQLGSGVAETADRSRPYMPFGLLAMLMVLVLYSRTAERDCLKFMLSSLAYAQRRHTRVTGGRDTGTQDQ